MDVVWHVVEAPQSALEDPDVISADWVGQERGVGGTQAFVRRGPDGSTSASVVEILEWMPPRRAVLALITGFLPGFEWGSSFELAELGDGHTRLVHVGWCAHPAGLTATGLAAPQEVLKAGIDGVCQHVAAAVARRVPPDAL